ncbi:hypothetical protein GCM10023339_17090 [Alloalcanivorax gelatiniphagus]
MHRRGWLGVALATWLVAALLLTGLAVGGGAYPEEVPDAPEAWGAAWAWGMVLVTVQAVVLFVLRARPPAALVAAAALAPVGAVAGLGPAIGSLSVAVMVAAFVVTQSALRTVGGLALVAAALLVAGGELVVQLRAGAPLAQSVGGALLQGVGTVGLTALVGFLVATRRDSRDARAGRSRAEAGERAALVEAAVARERTAMARELHDIAAHHLTGIAVMSAAISKQIDRDPAAAKQGVDQVRDQTRSMLRDMRGLVSLLRPDADGVGADGGTGEGVPTQESFDGIAALVDAAVVRGEPVELVVRAPEGRDPREHVGPLAQLSAYRTVQEALTNAARHAPGAPCRVELDARSEGEVRITVTNGMPRAGAPRESGGGGFGLVGMRERAELTGCRLTAGPVDRGWQVLLVVPVRDQPLLDAPAGTDAAP